MERARSTAQPSCRNTGQVFLAPAMGDEPPIDSVVVMIRALSWLLRRAREYHGWPQADVAERCGISMSVLSRAELARREPRLWLVLRACNVLGVRFSDVMRMAEDQAFPVDSNPWTDRPADVLGPPRRCAPTSELGPQRRSDVSPTQWR